MAAVIGASLTSGTAPLLVGVDAIASTGLSADIKLCRVQWDFGDGTDFLDLQVFGGAVNTNIQEGIGAGHVYRTPDTYTITCRITDTAGVVHVETQQIVVAAFAGTTYYVSNGGADTNTGLSESDPFRTFEHAMSVVLAGATRWAASPYRVLLQLGGTYPVADTIQLGHGLVGPIYIGSYGESEAPVPELHYASPSASAPMMQSLSGPVDFTVDGVNVRGPYDFANSAGPAVSAFYFPHTYDVRYPSRLNQLFNRVEITDFYQGIINSYYGDATTTLPQMVNVGVMECTTDRVADASLYLGARYMTVHGCNFKTGKLSHVARSWWADRSSIADNFFLDPLATRHALKLHAPTGVAFDTQWVSVRANMFRGGEIPFACAPQNASSNERVHDIVIERNRIPIVAGLTTTCCHVVARGVVARGNEGFGGSPGADLSMFTVEEYAAVTGFAPRDIALLGNGFAHEGATGTRFLTVLAANVQAVELRGNAMILPNGGTSAHFIYIGAGSSAQITDTRNATWLGSGLVYAVEQGGVQRSFAQWQGGGHAQNSQNGTLLGVLSPLLGDLTPHAWSTHRSGCVPDARVYEDHYGLLRSSTAPTWSFGSVEVNSQGGPPVTMRPEWADAVILDVREAQLVLLSSNWVAEQPSFAWSILSDAAITVSDNVWNIDAAVDRPSFAWSVNEASLVSFGGVTIPIAAGERPSFAWSVREAVLGLIQQELAVDPDTDRPSFAWTILSDAEMDVTAGTVLPCPEYAAISWSIQEARLLLAYAGATQKFDINRSIRFGVRIRRRKALGDRIYLGQALGYYGGIVRAWRIGDPFAGFAAERGSPEEHDMQVWVLGHATLEVVGVTSQVNVGSIVYLVNDNGFTLTAGTEPVGRVAQHIYGRRVRVAFSAFDYRRLP